MDGGYFLHPTKPGYWVYFTHDEMQAAYGNFQKGSRHYKDTPVELDWDKPDRHSSPAKQPVTVVRVTRPHKVVRIIRSGNDPTEADSEVRMRLRRVPRGVPDKGVPSPRYRLVRR